MSKALSYLHGVFDAAIIFYGVLITAGWYIKVNENEKLKAELERSKEE